MEVAEAVEEGIAVGTCTALGLAFADYTDPSVEVYTAFPRESGPCIAWGDYVGKREVRIDPARTSVGPAAYEVAFHTYVVLGGESVEIEEVVLFGIVASRLAGRELRRKGYGIGLLHGRGWVVVGMLRQG